MIVAAPDHARGQIYTR